MVFYVFLCCSVIWCLYGPFCHGALTLYHIYIVYNMLSLKIFSIYITYNYLIVISIYLFIQVVRMLIIVVVLFVICWMPLQLYNVIQEFWPEINE